MKKRGMVLIVASLFILLLAVLAYSAQQDVGCCANPESSSVIAVLCTQTNESQCCSGAASYSSCVGSYFYKSTQCSAVSQCQSGCCICVKNGVNFYDRDRTPIKTGAECSKFCTDLGGTVKEHNKSITDFQRCVDLYIGAYSAANLSGYVKNTAGDGISNAIVSADSKNTTTNANGFYQLTNITPELSKTISVSHASYPALSVQINISSGANSYNFTLILAGTGKINGTVKNSNNLPIANAVVSIGAKSSSTNAVGYYEISDLALNRNYTITASAPGYKAETQIIFFSAGAAKNFVLSKQNLARLSGAVYDDETQEMISGAQIRLDDPEGNFPPVQAASSLFGVYSFESIPVKEFGTTRYTITVSKEGFYTRNKEGPSLTPDANVTKYDIGLTKFSAGCGGAVKPGDFKANHVQGEKAVLLSWSNPCSIVSRYFISRQYSGLEPEQLGVFDSSQSRQFMTFKDASAELEWAKTYTYSIIAVYDSLGENSVPATSTITLGDSRCEGILGEFCLNSTQRARCDPSNKVTSQGITGKYANCADQGANYFCTGPDANSVTYCKDESKCSPQTQQSIFGLYTNPFQIGSAQSCYGGIFPPPVQENYTYPNYCYYDFSSTIVDKCYSCSNLEYSCFNYLSESACSLDSRSCQVAGKSGCKWISVNKELGKGICYQEDYKGTDQCSLCSEQRLFFNKGCSQEVCSKLGRCYSVNNETSCVSCDEGAICEQFKSEKECGRPVYISEYGEINPGTDSCGLGVCRWNGTACFKDGDADTVPDCRTDEGFCQSDTKPPVTSIKETSPTISKSGSTVTFVSDQDAESVYFCITKNPDARCSASDFKKQDYGFGEAEVDLMDYREAGWLMDNVNVYYVKFYSVDGYKNRESVKTKKIFADMTVPDVSIYYDVIPRGSDAGDLMINILSNKIVFCTDSLGIASSLLSAKVEYVKQVNYSNLNYGLYVYNLECTDSVGNTVTKSEEINVQDPFIIINFPYRVISGTEFNFDVTTTGPASSCTLYSNDVIDEEMASESQTHFRSSLHRFNEANRHYSSYKIICYSGEGARTAYAPFTIDTLPPLTSAVMNSNKEGIKQSGNNWVSEFDENIVLKLECKDSPVLGFGCGETVYCTGDKTCNPSLVYNRTINVNATSFVCYKSKDKGKIEETVKCGKIVLRKDIGIRLVLPRYGASSVPNFKLRISTEKPTSQCKYSAIPTAVFSQITNEKQIFSRISSNTYEKDNFPALLSYNWTSLPFNLYVNCNDSETGKFSDHPVLFEIYYDPSAPKLISAYASNSGGSGTSTITSLNAVIVAVTDEPGLCKFSRLNQNYASMESSFQGFEFEQFETQHYAFIDSLADKTSYKYYVQCMNKAGLYSNLAEIKFAVDRNQAGAIISASGKYKDGKVTFSVETNRQALCQYSKNNFVYSSGTAAQMPQQSSGLIHSLDTVEFTEEGSYEAFVKCMFENGLIADKKIKFAVDKTPPVMSSITVGDHVCDPKAIKPLFSASDPGNLSAIVQYNYTVWEAAGIFDRNITSGTTSDNNPKIKVSLEMNRTYYIEASAKDSADLWSSSIESTQFDVIEKNSSLCKEQGPPRVTIEQTVNSDGTKNIAIICSDESGCSTVLYGTSASEAECVPLQDYSAPILVYQTAYVCWEAYDTTGNKATGSQKITFGVEGDSDGDGIQDTADKCPNTPPTQTERIVIDSGSPNYGCSPDEIDSDRDGMPDYWEQQYGLSPYDPNDSYLDLDSDGLTNYEEYLQHTDPTIAEIADSDNDRIPDNKDMCPNTPFGTSVDSNGCPLAPVVTPPAPSAEKRGIFPIILLIFGLLLAGFGAAMLLIPKFKPKPRYAPAYRPQQRYAPARPSAPAVSRFEEQKRKILEKITREREAKSAERKKFFERFGKEEAPAPVIRETPVEKEFKKPEYSRIPEKITIPESRSEFEKLAKLTEQHITLEKSPKQILEMTGASKTQFDRLKSLIKERIGVKRKAPEELTKEQKDEIKNIFSRLGKLKKK